jgi:excisionase family DNA binding protein
MFTKVEVHRINAQDLLHRFDSIENKLTQLSETVKPQEATELITRQQVADLFGVSLVTVHEWTKKGVLLAYRIGNKVRFKRNEVLNQLQLTHPRK